MKPVLVILTSDTCGHCVIFRKGPRVDVLNALRDQDRVEIVEIHTNNSSGDLGAQNHPDLGSFIAWNPAFLLFTGESWGNHDTPLIGEILGGKKIGSEIRSILTNRPKHDVNGIVGWVNKTLELDIFSNVNNGNVNNGNVVMAPNEPYRVNSSSSNHPDFPMFGRVAPRNPNILPGARNASVPPPVLPGSTPHLPTPKQNGPPLRLPSGQQNSGSFSGHSGGNAGQSASQDPIVGASGYTPQFIPNNYSSHPSAHLSSHPSHGKDNEESSDTINFGHTVIPWWPN